MSVTTPTATATPTKSDRAPREILYGLITLGALAAVIAMVTIGTLGIMVATGTLRPTSQGWTFRPPAGSAAAREIRTGKLDPSVDSIFIAQGSGSSQTAQFTASQSWSVDWSYSCPGTTGSFRVVAQGLDKSFTAGSLDKSAAGAGNSTRVPAGTYSLRVTTNPGCTWNVGARPNH